MSNTPPTPEAVEAARKYATNDEQLSKSDCAFLHDLRLNNKEEIEETVARILAAEVDRLRAELKEAKDWHVRIIGMTEADPQELTWLRLEREQLRARVAELERRLTSSERARISLSDACDSLQAEIRQLRAQIAELGLEAATINDMVCGDDGPRGHEATTLAIRKLLNEQPSNPRQLASTPLPPPDGPGWLPIETAPKDGTHIVTAEQYKNGWWFSEDWWVEDGIDDWQFASYASHWMPLPATPPPAPTKEGDGTRV